jgi:sugar lactone lactonase YvrE
VRSFGDHGSGPGQLDDPKGIAVDGAGYVYVADSANSRVERFTPAGQFAASIGQGFSLSARPDQLSAPEGVAIAPDGTLFASDQQQRRVQHYAPDGAFLGSFGSQGSGDGQFQATGSLAVAPDGGVYVADWSLSSVQRFTAGAFYARVGNGVGSGPGQFSHPFYLAVDCRGTLYVADVDNDRIQRLGDPGAASCGDPAQDRSERLVLTATARTPQRFRTTFAVAVAVACDRPCTAKVAGSVRLAGQRRALRVRAQSKPLDGTKPLTVRVAPSERDTDRVLAALRRHRRVVATLRVTATDLRGQHRAVTRRVRLR